VVLLLHPGLVGPPNLVQNCRLYPAWAIGSRLSLQGEKCFSGSDQVSVLDNMSWVQVLADIILCQASTHLIPYILLFAMVVAYESALP